MKKVLTNLTFWVLTAITAGALLGAYMPETAVEMKILGDRFIDLVKLFINPIIFLTITLGIAAMGDLKKVGKTGGKALIYFEVVTTLALLVGIIVAFIIQPGAGVDTTKAVGADVTKFTKTAETFSWWQFFKDNFTLQVLLFSLILGSFLSKYKEKKVILDPLSKISTYVFKALHFVMYLAPIGAFGGSSCHSVRRFGIASGR